MVQDFFYQQYHNDQNIRGRLFLGRKLQVSPPATSLKGVIVLQCFSGEGLTSQWKKRWQNQGNTAEVSSNDLQLFTVVLPIAPRQRHELTVVLRPEKIHPNQVPGPQPLLVAFMKSANSTHLQLEGIRAPATCTSLDITTRP